MIYLSPTRNQNDIGQRRDLSVMLSFGSNSVGKKHLARTVFGIDNGCFKRPDINTGDYLKWLELLLPYQKKCLFAVAPDVVGDSRETWKRSAPVLPEIRALGFKAALVAQDGMENYPIRWGSFDVLFVGGTTEWKLSEAAFGIVHEARQNGCHIHFGRVNSRQRLRTVYLAGADSADGTMIVFKPDERLKQLKSWLDELHRQPFLFGLQRAI